MVCLVLGEQDLNVLSHPADLRNAVLIGTMSGQCFQL